MNPITYSRNQSLLSTTALARQLEVSRQYLTRLEQGLYDKPNKNVMNWVVEQFNKDPDLNVTVDQVIQTYKDWQSHKRRDTKIEKKIEPLEVISNQSTPDQGLPIVYYHRIFREWRCKYWETVHSFCVEMCLHPSPINNYEEGLIASMPENLRLALKDLDLIGEGFKTYER